MDQLNNQKEYWNRVAQEKTFTLPVDLKSIHKTLSLESRILDFGCGYGRVCRLLEDAGYTNVFGVDSAQEMILRGRELYPDLDLQPLPEGDLPFPPESFDAVLLVAVLTCIPENDGQRSLITSLQRLLRPGGILYISDYLLQEDERNLQRYAEFEQEFGVYGTFRLPEGTVVRHHTLEWLQDLTSGFETVDIAYQDVDTMNGNKAKGVQWMGRNCI